MVDRPPGKILIVDDEKFNCSAIKGFLVTLGLKDAKKRSLMCYDGEQAVKAILEAVDENEPYRYSLILMDV